MADRHGRQGQRRRRRSRQADGRRGRLRRAGLRAAEQLHLRRRSRTKSGNYVAPTLASTSAAAKASRSRPTSASKSSTPPAPTAYPITSQTFIVVNKDLCKAGTPGRRRSRQGRREVPRIRPRRRASTILAQADYAALPAPILAKSKEAVDGPAVQRLRRSPEPMTVNSADQVENSRGGSIDPGGDRALLARSPLARLPDRALKYGLTVLAALILALIVYFFIRLVGEARPGVRTRKASSASPSTTTGTRAPNDFGALPLVVGTLITSALALLIGVPSPSPPRSTQRELCPRRLRTPLTILVELLAAVPSVVYGLWGIFFLAPKLQPAEQWVADRLSFIPFIGGGTRHDPQLLHRRPGARDHDPADRQRDQPRGHGHRPGRPQGGGARPRRDALGDDPHRRAPLLPLGHRRRRDARVWAGRSARRSPSRS